MDAVGTVESEVRELIRRSGLDPTRAVHAMRQLVADAVADSADGALQGGLPPPPAPRAATKAGPEAMLRELAQQASPPIAGLHFYCFGGLAHTARWLRAMLEGRFELIANGDVHVGTA